MEHIQHPFQQDTDLHYRSDTCTPAYPADYGLLAMVSVFTAVLGIFTDGGLTMALVRKENRTETDMATVFWYNLIACWMLYGILFLAAPYIADFYGRPILKDITRITTLGLLYGPLI